MKYHAGEPAADIALLVGISSYDDPGLKPLQDVPEELELVTGALEACGFHVAAPMSGRHTVAEVKTYLRGAAAARRRLVIYWTGHGSAGPAGQWLFTSESSTSNPHPDSAMSARDLAALLDELRGPSQIVVFLDCCGSGSTALRVAQEINLSDRRTPDASKEAVTISLVSSTYDHFDASSLDFARALAHALHYGPPASLFPTHRAMLTPQEVAKATDNWLRHHGAPQRVREVGLDAGTEFFRHRRHDPTRRDLSMPGVAAVRRETVLSALTEWRERTPCGLFVLTGSPGTGKTHVLGQWAEECWAAARSIVSRTVRVELDAGSTVESVLAEVALRAGMSAVVNAGGGTVSFHELIMETGVSVDHRLLLIIDAFDAATQAHQRAIVERLLQPLSVVDGVHVVVAATGGAMVPGVSDAFSEVNAVASSRLDLDEDPGAHDDLARLIETILLGYAFSRYRGDQPGWIAPVAAEIARASGGVFLLGIEITNVLARGYEALAPEDPKLKAVIRATIDATLDSEVGRYELDGAALQALRALAWIEAPGVPAGPEWLTIARALGGSVPDLADGSIHALLPRISSYLSCALHGGEFRYRLRSLPFGSFLRSRTVGAPTEVQRVITAALRPPVGQWSTAAPYVKEQLAVHASRAGMLPELFRDHDLMLYAEPAALGVAASRVPTATRSWVIDLYLRAAAFLQDLEPALRVFVLRSLDEEGRKPHERRQLVFSIDPPCRVLWTSAPLTTPHRVIHAAPTELSALAVLPVNDRWLVATAGTRFGVDDEESSGVELLDLAASASSHLEGTAGSVIGSLAVGRTSTDSLLICAYENDVLEAWSLSSRAPVWSKDTVMLITYMFMIWSGQEDVLLTTNSHDTIRTWRLSDGAPLGIFTPGGGAHLAVAANADGRDVVWIATNTGHLCQLDAATLELLVELKPEQIWERAVAATVRGKPMLIGARGDGKLEMRRADDGRLISVSRDKTDELADTMCVVDGGGGHPPTVATVNGSEIVLWSTNPLTRLTSFGGHTDDVTALGIVPTPSGSSALVSASKDGTVRVWPTVDNLRQDFGAGSVSVSYQSMYLAELAGEPVILAEESGCRTVVDVSTGVRIRSFETPVLWMSDPEGTSHDIQAIALRGSDAMAITYNDGAGQRMWSLTDGEEYRLPTAAFGARATAASVVGTHADALTVLGDGDGPVMSFDAYGDFVARFEVSSGGVPSCPVAFSIDPLVLVRFDDRYVIFDARLGTAVRYGNLAVESLSTELVAAVDKAGLWLVSTCDEATWLCRFGTHPSQRQQLLDRPSASAAAVAIGDEIVAAVADLDRLRLFLASDGRELLCVPFVGQVRSVISTGPHRLAVIAGGRLVHIEVSADILEADPNR